MCCSRLSVIIGVIKAKIKKRLNTKHFNDKCLALLSNQAANPIIKDRLQKFINSLIFDC